MKMSLKKENELLDSVFSSLGDSTRRGLLEKIKQKPLTVLELASDFNISLPAVSKHIKVLNKAGLIKREKNGRFIYCSMNHDSLKPAIEWISSQYDIWDKSFEKLRVYINKLNEKK